MRGSSYRARSPIRILQLRHLIDRHGELYIPRRSDDSKFNNVVEVVTPFRAAVKPDDSLIFCWFYTREQRISKLYDFEAEKGEARSRWLTKCLNGLAGVQIAAGRAVGKVEAQSVELVVSAGSDLDFGDSNAGGDDNFLSVSTACDMSALNCEKEREALKAYPCASCVHRDPSVGHK